MKNQIINLLKKYTNHNFIKLTSRGNEAIFAALYCTRKLNKKKTVLIPDQGGWLSYNKYPKMLGLNTELVKTDYGLIDLNDLKSKIKNANCLLYQNPAGYFANQEIEEIYRICKDKCLVILDVAGSIGDKELSNGNFADFMIGSFGKWKPVNLGYGGFLSTNNKEYFEPQENQRFSGPQKSERFLREPKEIFNTTKFDDKYNKQLFEKLKDVEKRLDFFYKKCNQIKKDLKRFDIIHKDRKGINVIVKFNNKKEFDAIKD